MNTCGKWVAWTKPEIQSFKLNTDGLRRGNVTTYGGVLRDSHGDFILGFANKLTQRDVLQAELDAMVYGLQMCRDRVHDQKNSKTTLWL